MIQMHHDIAFEPDNLAAAGDPQAIRGQCAVGQLDVNMFLRRHGVLAHVDKGLVHIQVIFIENTRATFAAIFQSALDLRKHTHPLTQVEVGMNHEPLQ